MNKAEAIAILDMSKHMATSGRLYNQAIDMAIEALSERTGEWIDKGNWMGFECSRCKCHSRYVTPFCPQCGTRMVNDETL